MGSTLTAVLGAAGVATIAIGFVAQTSLSNFIKLKNSLMMDIKKRFNEEGIEIPFPHLTVYTGSVTEPFPFQVKEPDGSPKNS